MQAVTIKSGRIEATLLNYGATVQSLRVPNKHGEIIDVVLGHDNADDYLFDRGSNAYFGCICGRVANRIAYGKFSLDGVNYTLAVNNGQNALHGGPKQAFSHQYWTIIDQAYDRVTLQLVSEDMQEGYPGTLQTRVVYQVYDDSDNNQYGLRIKYHSQLLNGKSTIVNLTNHSYFNLSGLCKDNIVDNHIFRIGSQQYLEFDADNHQIPTGKILDTLNTPLDLSRSQNLKDKINYLQKWRGYDHCYAIDTSKSKDSLQQVATVQCPQSGVQMQFETTEPAFMFYTANWLDEKVNRLAKACHEVEGYGQYAGFCFEAQRYVDAINHKDVGWDNQLTMSKKVEITNLTPESAYSDVITFQGGRFKNLSKEVVDQSRKNFKSYDLDSDNFLDFHDVTKMMEKLQQTKTATEVKKMIQEIDKDQDGKISFIEFLAMLSGPDQNGKAPDSADLPIFGRIYNGGLSQHAKFFEQQAAATKDTTADNRDKIKKEYEEKKKLQDARKAELDRERKEAEEKERIKEESKQRLAARAAMFQK
ncbi:hypothetical protein MP228_008634 [Amoeboaphelidium protococcarum]|nr:hypothetical protein MP228_008634 [Amoeboaphelidium protococcarum]